MLNMVLCLSLWMVVMSLSRARAAQTDSSFEVHRRIRSIAPFAIAVLVFCMLMSNSLILLLR